MAEPAQRASHAAIFEHLEALFETKTTASVIEIARMYQQGQVQAALARLNELDAPISGYGIYCEQDRMLPGVYRPLSYVSMPLKHGHGQHYTRSMIAACGAYLEFVLKRMIHLNFFERILDGFNRFPLGKLVAHYRSKLPPSVVQHLEWFAREIYNFAKHDYDLEHREEPAEHEHFFDLDEALAMYLVVRKIGRELEIHSRLAEEVFLKMV